MSNEFYITMFLQGGFATVILASGEQVIPVFDDLMLAQRYADQLIREGRGPIATSAWKDRKARLDAKIGALLTEQSVSGVRLVFPDDDMYWPLIRALGL
jgi:hypothetical protein